MELEALRAVCKALPGVTEDVKWGGDLVFSVAGKMFAVFGLETGGLSFKAAPETRDALLDEDGVRPAPYLARHGWVLVDEPHSLPDDRLAELIRASYALVVARLPRKVREALGGRAPEPVGRARPAGGRGKRPG